MNKLFIFIFATILDCSLAFSNNVKESPIDFSARIAIIDTQQIIDKSHAIQDIKNNVELISQNLQKSMTSTEASLKMLEEELVKKRQTLSESEFNQEVRNFHNMVREVKKQVRVKKSDLEQAHQDAMNQVNQRIKEITSELATKYNFNLTMPSTTPLLFRSDIEITEEVLTILNDTLKTVQLNLKNSD